MKVKNSKVDDFLTIWATKSKKSLEEIQKQWEQIKKDFEAAGVTNERIMKGKLVRNLRSQEWAASQGKTKKEPVFFTGFILGADKLTDTFDWPRKVALTEYQRDPEMAKLQGLVDDAGTPLDQREEINNFGKKIPNPNYHRPLTGTQYRRSLFGVALKEGDQVPKLFRMTLWRGTAETLKYQTFVPIKFMSTVRGENPFLDLNVSKETKFSVIKNPVVPVEDWVKTALKDRMITWNDFESTTKNTGKGCYDPWVAIEGDVDTIFHEINPVTNSRSMVLTDFETAGGELKIFMPSDLELGFRESSRVIVFGILRKWFRRDDPVTPNFSLNAMSVYGIPGQTIEESTSKPVSAVTEKDFEILWENE